MGVVKKTTIEFFLVLAVGAALGFGLNPWRGSNRIKLRNDYHPDLTAVVEAARAKADQTAAEEHSIADTENTKKDSAAESKVQEIDPPEPVVPPDERSREKAKAPDHPYKEISFKEVEEVFFDPGTELGVNVFIDARNDDAFAEGHIPGALQCDRYRLDEYIDEVLEAASQADKVIIYCNGGQCDDSKAVCGELIQRGIPFYNVFLYSGGWEEWIANEMQYDTGGGE